MLWSQVYLLASPWAKPSAEKGNAEPSSSLAELKEKEGDLRSFAEQQDSLPWSFRSAPRAAPPQEMAREFFVMQMSGLEEVSCVIMLRPRKVMDIMLMAPEPLTPFL